MSRLLLLALIAALHAAPVAAQDTLALRQRADSLERVLDSLDAAIRAERLARVARSLPRVPERLDTVQVGPARLIARREDMPRVSAAFRGAWAGLAPLAGDVASRLPQRTFAVSVHDEVRIFATLAFEKTHRIDLLAGPRWRSDVDPAHHELGELLDATVDRGLRTWAGGGVLTDGPDWARVYRHLGTSVARPARECRAGDIAACREALLLDVSAPSADWYSLPALQAFVARNPASLSLQPRAACLAGSREACLAALERLGGIPDAISRTARLALARHAVARGGAGSYERLLADTTSALPERLAAAAGMPLDRLVAEWHSQVMREKPVTNASLGLSLAAALFWSTVAYAFAARSTRCRTG